MTNIVQSKILTNGYFSCDRNCHRKKILPLIKPNDTMDFKHEDGLMLKLSLKMDEPCSLSP